MALSNYPAERTIPVAAKGSSSYPENKTIPIKLAGTAAAYPLHKTFSVALKKAAFVPAGSTASAQKKETATASNYSSPKITRVILKTDPVSSAAGQLKDISSANYPQHKTTKVSIQTAAISSAEQEEKAYSEYPQHKTAAITLKTRIAPGSPIANIDQRIAEKTIQPEKSSKAAAAPKKKTSTLILVSACALFVIITGVLSWMYWQQTKQVDLLLADQQKLEEITGLKVDDIVGGGLKSNDKFAQTSNIISDIKFIRICFTANGSEHSQSGQKTFFVRLVNPDNTPILLNESQAIKVNGKNLEYTFAKEMNYENGELFVCRDIEKPEDLSAGTYKIEVYSNGALKGEGRFDLK